MQDGFEVPDVRHRPQETPFHRGEGKGVVGFGLERVVEQPVALCAVPPVARQPQSVGADKTREVAVRLYIGVAGIGGVEGICACKAHICTDAEPWEDARRRNGPHRVGAHSLLA